MSFALLWCVIALGVFLLAICAAVYVFDLENVHLNFSLLKVATFNFNAKSRARDKPPKRKRSQR